MKAIASNILQLILNARLLSANPRLSLPNQTVSLQQKRLDPAPLYFMRYMRKAIVGMCIKQKVSTENKLSYFVPFKVTEKECARWNRTFETEGNENQFSFYLKSSSTIFPKMMKDCGINFKNVFHVKHQISYRNNNYILTSGDYKNRTKVINISPAGKNAMLQAVSEIRDENDRLILETRDYFMICNMDKSNLATLTGKKENYRSWMIPPKFQSNDIVKLKNKYIPKSRGLDYGKVSGDLAIVHTTHLAAKIFGFKRGFIQGLCTANMVIVNCPFAIKDFTINFLKPIFIETTVRIEYSDSAYRLYDENNKILAHGSYTMHGALLAA